MVDEQSKDGWCDNRTIKIVISITALWITAGSLFAWEASSLSPWLSIMAFGAVVTVIIAAGLHRESLQSSFGTYLSLIIIIAIIYTLFPMLFTSSLIGIDPNWFAIQAQAVIDAGHTNAITRPIYQGLAIYIIELAISAEITGLPIEQASIILPIASGIILPLVSATIALQLSDDQFAGLLAAGLVTISPSVVKYIYAPIPQSYGILLSSVFFLILLHYYCLTDRDMNRRITILLFGIAITLAFTHKLPLFVIILLLVSLLLSNRMGIFDLQHSRLTLPLFCGVILLSVWAFSIDFFTSIVLRLKLLLAVGFDPYTEFIKPGNAVRTKSGLQYILGRNVHWLVLTIVAGAGWLQIAKQSYSGMMSQRQQTQSNIVLLYAALMVGLLAIGLIGSAAAFRPVRVILLAAFLLAALAAVAISSVMNRKRHIAIVLIIIIFATQAFAIGILPDDNNGPRSYLTASEHEGKQFMSSYVSESIYTDSYYVRAGLNPDEPVTGYWRQHAGKYQSYDDAIFNGSFAPLSPDYIAHRTDRDIYSHTSFGGYWILTWNPKAKLDICGNLVYSTDDVVLYDTGECWTD